MKVYVLMRSEYDHGTHIVAIYTKESSAEDARYRGHYPREWIEAWELDVIGGGREDD